MASYYDDTYPNPCRGVTAGRGHHESDAEFAERMKPMTPPEKKEPVVTLRVSIPVLVGGYTGQRDAWEALTSDMSVAFDPGNPDKVILKQLSGHPQRMLSFSRSGLEAALRVVEEYGKG